MQFTYCPQCGSMDFMSAPNGKQCRKCHYQGPMSEGPMDKVNEIRKRAPKSVSSSPTKPAENASASMKELAEKLKSLKGKSTEDAEFL